MVLDGLSSLYGLKYDSATACTLPLYLCSYKLVSSVIVDLSEFFNKQGCIDLVDLREVNLVEVINVAVLGVVGEMMVQGIPIDWIHTQPSTSTT